jgi:hypothetical protein
MPVKNWLKTAGEALDRGAERAMRIILPGMDRAYGRLEALLEPCPHSGDWCPATLIYAAEARKPSEADVVCMYPGCGWCGRVPLAAISRRTDAEAGQ